MSFPPGESGVVVSAALRAFVCVSCTIVQLTHTKARSAADTTTPDSPGGKDIVMDANAWDGHRSTYAYDCVGRLARIPDHGPDAATRSYAYHSPRIDPSAPGIGGPGAA